jgi:hypothetical protein
MGVLCSTRGGDDKCVHNFGRKCCKGTDHSKDLEVAGKIVLK